MSNLGPSIFSLLPKKYRTHKFMYDLYCANPRLWNAWMKEVSDSIKRK